MCFLFPRIIGDNKNFFEKTFDGANTKIWGEIELNAFYSQFFYHKWR